VHGDGKELTTSITELWDVGIRWKDGKGTNFSGFRRVRELTATASQYQYFQGVQPGIRV